VSITISIALLATFVVIAAAYFAVSDGHV